MDQATGTWGWESVLTSPDTSATPGPTDGVFTATDEFMFVGFNIGGRADSGTANFLVDNVSITVVPEPATATVIGVIAAGGLHVLGTERYEALRIDRQLIGRAGRQGDPGSCQFFLSLEDDLLEGLGEDWQEILKETGQRGGNRNWQRFHRYFVKAQRRLEKRHYRNRVDLMVYEKRRQEVLKDLNADPYVD